MTRAKAGSKSKMLMKLASSSHSNRVAGARALCRALDARSRPPESDGLELLANECISGWQGVEVNHTSVLDALVTAFQTDGSLMLIECVAIALGTEGEAGLGELIELFGDDHFEARSKAVTGIAAAGARAQWVVSSLIELLEHETAPLVVTDTLDALGRIGGAEAKSFLLNLTFDSDFEFCDTAQEALDRIAVEEFVTSLP